MRIHRLDIQNFRGVRRGTVEFPEHALLVGPNSVGKSTVLEALDLVLGPDRATGPTTIDEHDFFASRYLAAASHPDAPALLNQADPEPAEVTDTDGDAAAPGLPEILLTVTLSSLTEEELTRFRGHVELWNPAQSRVYTHDECETLETTNAHFVLRVAFRGRYEPEEDEFEAETVFLHPEGSDGEYPPFGKMHKRAIGFLYLRALRTGRRAATLQRGSLLDILLHLDDTEPRIWQQTLDQLAGVGSTANTEPTLRAVLDELERAMCAYVPGRRSGSPPSRLHVTQLTREQLRTVMSYFVTDPESSHSLPYDRLGSGTTNLIVLALLTLIARRKQNVIFAMEEPEIALGPTVQRRIVAELKRLAKQSLITSHSPYVAEQMLPADIVVLRRRGGVLSSQRTAATVELKEKILRQQFRQRYAEGLLGNALVVVEGETEMYALPAASDVIAGVPETTYRSLDVLGIVPVLAGGDGELAKVAGFYFNAGIDTYVFADRLNSAETRREIQEVSSDLFEHPHGSFERLLAEEMPLPAVQSALLALRKRTDFPKNVTLPQDDDVEKLWRDAFYQVLDKRKTEGYAAIVFRRASADDLPRSLRRYLARLHELVTDEQFPPSDPAAHLFE